LKKRGLWIVVCGVLAGCIGSGLICPAGAQAETLKESFGIVQSPETKSVRLAGNLDETRFLWPNMPAKKRLFSSIRIANEGDRAVLNPRVSVNGFRVPLSSDELLQTISSNPEAPLDRVLRIFHAISRYSTHASPLNEPPVPLFYFLNGSWGLCNDKTAVQSSLWDLSGYRWRESEPYNHTSAEVEIQGKTLHLDADLQAYYLKHDNLTIASAQDIREDPMLVLRAVHERSYDRFPRLAAEPDVEMYFSSEKYAALYPPRDSSPPLTSRKQEKKILGILLRPGEAYGWHTAERKIIHPSNGTEDIAAVARDLLWETSLDLSNSAHRWFLNDGKGKKDPINQAIIDMKDSVLTIPYQLPLPVIGMQIRLIPLNAEKHDLPGAHEKISIVLVTPEQTFEERAPYADVIKGFHSLDGLVKSIPFPLREFQLRIDGRRLQPGDRRAAALQGIRIRLNGLSTVFAFRALRTGKNTLVYTDDSPSRSVRIDIAADPEQVALPYFPNAHFLPRSRAEVSESRLRFVWPGAAGDHVTGYHLQISLFPDMRYPLSPTFDRLIRGGEIRTAGGAVRFRLPWRGMLPVNKTLYWRVRPFNDTLLAGDWSEIRSFRVIGPGAPENLRTTEQDGKIVLTWKPADYGSSPVHYEIHMSSLEGFMPMDKPHRILGFSDREAGKKCWHDVCATSWPVVPATFISTTRETKIVLNKSLLTDKKKRLGAQWRVIAVDAKGSQSCPSPQGFLRTPMLVPPEIIALPPGKATYQVPVIGTLGRVLAGPPDYYLGTWSNPRLTYTLQPAAEQKPSDWNIDRANGIIRGTLAAGEEISLRVSVQDHYGRKDAKVLKLKAEKRK